MRISSVWEISIRPELSHRVVARVRREQFGHFDRLLMMADHPLHELDIGGRRPNRMQIDRFFRADLAGGLPRRAWLDEQRLRTGSAARDRDGRDQGDTHGWRGDDLTGSDHWRRQSIVTGGARSS